MNRLDGPTFRAMIHAAHETLAAHQGEVNALNVFPVPDGDTGTNMTLTMASACREVDRVSSDAVGEVARAVAQGSLMGARGNSGVILSQILRGFARRADGKRELSPLDLAAAFHDGVEVAYRAVMKPVEGTILTVARGFARAAMDSARKGGDIREVLRRGLDEGRQVLDRTPSMLAVLRQAGVVDAGGKGFLVLLEGALDCLLSADGQRRAAAAPAAPAAVAPEFTITAEISDIRYVYDTELLVRGQALDADVFRRTLERLGDSVLVVGDPSLLKVHVHTNQPGQVLDYCIRHGEVVEIEIKNMREQHEALRRAKAAAQAEPVPAAGDPVPAPPGAGAAAEDSPVPETKPFGFVAVATGAGLQAALKSLGADAVVDGGQTMNPSTEELARAAASVAADTVIILPNNKNVVLAAQQVKDLLQREVRVVPTADPAEGMAALLAVNPTLDAGENLRRMAAAVAEVRAGEVTYAVRDSRWGDLEIKAGDCVGLFEGELAVTGKDRVEVLLRLLGQTVDGDTTLVTVFTGRAVDEEEVGRLREEFARRFPDVELEIHQGGQPTQYFLFWLE